MNVTVDILDWRTVGLVVALFGFAPGVVLRLVVKVYPKGHVRRAELILELYGRRYLERPLFVAQQIEIAMTEGLPARLRALRGRRTVCENEDMDGVSLSGVAAGQPTTLAEGRNETKRWHFKGGTGTYLRAATLPGLHRGYSEETDVWVEIIAPDDDTVTKYYAEYRRQLQERQPTRNGAERWTDTWAKIEAYATVVAAVWYSLHTKLRVHVALSSTISTCRYDRSDRSMVIANESPEAYRLKIEAESQFFAGLDENLRASFKQARRLDISEVTIPRDFGAEDVRRTLSMVDGLMFEPDFLTDDTCHEIGSKAIGK